jgi:hypothetical protein
MLPFRSDTRNGREESTDVRRSLESALTQPIQRELAATSNEVIAGCQTDRTFLGFWVHLSLYAPRCSFPTTVDCPNSRVSPRRVYKRGDQPLT